MRHLLPVLGLIAPTFFAPSVSATDYLTIDTCDQFVEFFNNRNYGTYIELNRDLDCKNSPTLTKNITYTINGNGFTISNLNFDSTSSVFARKLNLQDITFENTTIHNNDEDFFLWVDKRWSNVTFNNLVTTGKPFEMLFYSLKNVELTDLSIDLSGVKLENVKTLLGEFVNDSRITNLNLSGATIQRRNDWVLALLVDDTQDSYFTNIKLKDFDIYGEPTGANGRTTFIDTIENIHVNGLSVENVHFSRSENDSFFHYERDEQSTYVNISHNLFDDTTDVGAIPAVAMPRGDVTGRIINFESMNQPLLPPAMCTPYLLQDSYFGIKPPTE
ncbi:hypothetical protein [Vibrio sp. D431a]|uniref:hypothetical protein n=1 Tax=Vibrio sp. D431a TaxID=2837388 RepID=UPI002552F750|nr:hypothetical protein [Vibrio sp. D431a]MDK9790023.1 hypothetical protein [Vibrio sp. D431a]